MRTKETKGRILEGWIKLYRHLIDDGWLQNHDLLAFWIYCLLKASHKEHKQTIGFKQVSLKKGQFVFGRQKAAEDLRTTESKIRTAVKVLTMRQSITVDSTNAFSIITVINWDSYQSAEGEIDQQIDQRVTSGPPAGNHKQELKNETMQKKKKDPSVADKTAHDPANCVSEILKKHCDQNINSESKENIDRFWKEYEQFKTHSIKDSMKTTYDQRKPESKESTFSNPKSVIDKTLMHICQKKHKLAKGKDGKN
jgi:hypothetical protein